MSNLGIPPSVPPAGPSIRVRSLVVVLAFGLVLWFASRQATPPQPRTLSLYCFSALETVMNDGILPAFQDRWRTRTGEKLEFIAVYAGSGIIVDRIVHEVTPQVAIVSSEIDALRLFRAGALADEVWKGLPHRGVLSRSPMVFLCRPGPSNPTRFRDLAEPGVRLIQPDPATSGAGVWSLIGVYADAAAETGVPKGVDSLLLSMWKNVVHESSSARAALRAYREGRGDVLVTYEQQGLEQAASGNLDGQLVYPDPTVMSEHIVVPVHRNIESEDRELVEAFTRFLWSEEAAALLRVHGFRGPQGDADGFAACNARTLDDLGGAWMVANRVVDEIWGQQVAPALPSAGG